ncbi:hypothetical protein PENSPDRAFT_695087 [Peniophora sp. CONT]|nr:hypothetical protein PENSPDRAFT_695087 [Peniophora sp. CONT]
MNWFLAVTHGSIDLRTLNSDGLRDKDKERGLEDVDLYLDNSDFDFSGAPQDSGSSSAGSISDSSSVAGNTPTIQPGSTLNKFLSQLCTSCPPHTQPPRTRRKSTRTSTAAKLDDSAHNPGMGPLTVWFKCMLPEEAEHVWLASRAKHMEAEAERCYLKRQMLEIEKKAAKQGKDA